MLIVASSRNLRVIDGVDGAVVREVTLEGWVHSNPVQMRIGDRSGEPVLLVTYPNGARLWRLPELEVMAQWSVSGAKRIFDWDWCGDGTAAMILDRWMRGARIRQVDATTGREVGPRLQARERGRWFGTAPQRMWTVAAGGGYLFAGDANGAVWRWRMPSAEPASVWRGLHPWGPVIRLSTYMVDDRVVLATVGNWGLHLWDGETGQPIGGYMGYEDEPPMVAQVPWSGNPRHLLVANDLMLKRVDPRTGAWEVITRWETDDGRPRDEFSVSMEALCTASVNGRDVAFVVTSEDLWRIDADTGEPV